MKACVYCGAAATTRDHFIPKSLLFGSKTVPACYECNQKKADKLFTICLDCGQKDFRAQGKNCECGGKCVVALPASYKY